MKTKKYIASLLVFVLILVQTIIPVDAVNSLNLSVGTAKCSTGETVSLPVSIESNSGFVSMSLSITYDSSALTLISVDDTGLISGKSHSSHFTSPYVLSWENDTKTSNITATGTIAYLTFLVSEDAKEQDYSIIVRIPTDGILDANGNNVDAPAAQGTITVSKQHECYFGEWESCSKTKHARYCDCGEVEYERHNMDDGVIITEPTHAEDGEIVYTCDDCDYSYSDIIDAQGHDFGDWKNYDEESHRRYCDCGKDYEEAAHRWDDGEIAVAPTATAEGEIVYSCYDCEATRTEIIPPYGGDHVHNFVFVKAVNATCTSDGYDYYECSGCGMFNKANVVNALDHDYSMTNVKATCTNAGYTLYICARCGDSYKDNETATLGHIYENGVCTGCGKSETATTGDLNGDGFINYTDVELFAQYLIDWNVEVNTNALDVNGDRKINNKDVTRLIQYIEGWDVEIK